MIRVSIAHISPWDSRSRAVVSFTSFTFASFAPVTLMSTRSALPSASRAVAAASKRLSWLIRLRKKVERRRVISLLTVLSAIVRVFFLFLFFSKPFF